MRNYSRAITVKPRTSALATVGHTSRLGNSHAPSRWTFRSQNATACVNRRHLRPRRPPPCQPRRPPSLRHRLRRQPLRRRRRAYRQPRRTPHHPSPRPRWLGMKPRRRRHRRYPSHDQSPRRHRVWCHRLRHERLWKRSGVPTCRPVPQWPRHQSSRGRWRHPSLRLKNRARPPCLPVCVCHRHGRPPRHLPPLHLHWRAGGGQRCPRVRLLQPCRPPQHHAPLRQRNSGDGA